MKRTLQSKLFPTIRLVSLNSERCEYSDHKLTSLTEYSGEFSYLNFSNKIRKKIDEWMKTAAPEVRAFLSSAGLNLSPFTNDTSCRLLPKLNHLKIDGGPHNFNLDLH